MLELSRILTAAGATMAGVFFTVYGIGIAVHDGGEWEATLGLWGMIISLVATVVGLVMHHRLAED